MVGHESDRKPYLVYGEGDRAVLKTILVGPRDGFPGYLRQFSLGPGASTPYHRHDWYHVVYILEGDGVVKIEDEDQPLRQGSVVHAPAGRTHGFFNTGSSTMRFLCLVPETGDQYSPAD